MNHLQQITKRAKAIQKAKPSIKWTDAIKKASAEYRATNKTVKTRSVGGSKKTTTKKKVSSSKPITIKWNDDTNSLVFSDAGSIKVDYDGDFKYKGKWFETYDHESEKDLIRDLKKAFPTKSFKWISGISGTLYIQHKMSGKPKTKKTVGKPKMSPAFPKGEAITGLNTVTKNGYYFAVMPYQSKTYKAFHAGNLLVKYNGSYGGIKRFTVLHDARDLKLVKPPYKKSGFVIDVTDSEFKKSHFVPTKKPAEYEFKIGALKLNL